MLAGAAAYKIDGRLDFIQGDIAAYNQPADLIFSNAALQWLDGHERLIPRLAALVRPGGAIAVQMPSNFEAPSHLLLEETARNGPWTSKLKDWRLQSVQPLAWYVEQLLGLGLRVDAWETTYYFVLQGDDPVMEWVKGTQMQPILSLLDEAEQRAFCEAYAERVRRAYPPSKAGTVFPFKRIFFVGRK
jgi:trans-aconitate 2-methyltransferase